MRPTVVPLRSGAWGVPRRAHRLFGIAALALLCWLRAACAWADSRGEPCLTCRTDDCPTKPNIEAWCGEGDDPLARNVAPTAPSLPLVDINSEPSGATVSTDGHELGQTPLRGVRLRRGEHQLHFVLPGYAEVDWPIRIYRSGQQLLATLHKDSLPSPPAGAVVSTTARIDIETQPPGATVQLDEKEPVGVTPLHSVEVTKGPHLLALSLRGYQATVLDLLVQRDSERYLLTLRRPFCKKCVIGGVIGGVVVLGAVAVTVGLLLRPPSPPDDIRDPNWRVIPSP